MRWIEFQDIFLCLDHVTHFTIPYNKTEVSEDCHILAHLPFGYDASSYNGLDCHQEYIRFGPFESKAEAKETLKDMLSGKFDIDCHPPTVMVSNTDDEQGGYGFQVLSHEN